MQKPIQIKVTEEFHTKFKEIADKKNLMVAQAIKLCMSEFVEKNS